MQKYVILLRGINVGGRNKLKMADLKLLLSDSGFQKIKTYIQSGNLVGLYKDEKITKIEEMLELEIKGTFGYNIDVLVFLKEDFNRICNENPFNKKYDISKLHICFLSDELSESKITELRQIVKGDDEYFVSNNALYFVFQNGVSGSEIAKKFLSKYLGVKHSCRNGKTILQIQKLINQ